MKRFGWALGAAAMALSLTVPAHAAPAKAAAPAVVTGPSTALSIMKANEALAAEDCKAALVPLNRLWNDAYLDTQDPKLAAEFRLRTIACTADTTGMRDALILSTDNIARTSATVTAYDMHAFLLLIAKRPDLAADALDDAMTRFPDTAATLSDTTMLGSLGQLEVLAPGRAQALLDHAEQVRWQTRILAAEPALGLMRVEGLRTAIAARRDDLIALYRTDLKRDALSYIIGQGDGLISSTAAPEPVEPIMKAQIAAAQKAIVANPADLQTLAYLMTLERAAGQNEVALIQLNGIVALIDQYGVAKFNNPETYGELLADRGLLLAGMGRQEDADRAFADGEKRLSAPGMGANTGDFYVAYAGYLVARGDEAAAVALIDSLDIRGFDDAQKEALVAHDACAFARQGEALSYATYLRVVGDAQMRVAPRLCAGDADGAAQDLIALIGQPGLRSDAVHIMQTMQLPLPVSDKDYAAQKAMTALKARDDVKAAADAAGIIVRSWPLAY